MKRAQSEDKLPEGWVLIKLKETGEIISGGTPSTQVPEYWNGNIVWITPADLSAYKAKVIRKGAKSISANGLKKSSARMMPNGSVLFSSRAPIGYVVIAGVELCTNQGFKSVIPNKAVFNDFLYYYLKSAKRKAEEAASGTTFKEISLGKFSDLDFPLPPLPEQHAIVSKIEQLFSELEKGIESLKTAQQQLKMYRQSVLKWAFEGKLTNESVIEGELPDGWKWVKVKDIGKIDTGMTPSKSNPKFYANDFPFFKPTDLEAGMNVRVANDNLSKEGIEHARYLKSNSVLVTCIGATIGKTGLIRVDGACNQQINSISPHESYVSEFVFYQVISHWFQEQIKMNAVATTLPILNKSKFEKFDFIYCPMDEQHQIVYEIESRLSECDNMETTITISLQQAEALRQSILKKAFEGRLLNDKELEAVRDDPAWEPAERLLERIRAEKSGLHSGKKGQKSKA